MPKTLSQHPSERVFLKGSEQAGTLGVTWSLVKPYLEAHHVKRTLSLKLGTLGFWGQVVRSPTILQMWKLRALGQSD